MEYEDAKQREGIKRKKMKAERENDKQRVDLWFILRCPQHLDYRASN
jgi:hypothetical protein